MNKIKSHESVTTALLVLFTLLIALFLVGCGNNVADSNNNCTIYTFTLENDNTCFYAYKKPDGKSDIRSVEKYGRCQTALCVEVVGYDTTSVVDSIDSTDTTTAIDTIEKIKLIEMIDHSGIE